MSKLIGEAIDILRHVPEKHQDEIARAVMQLAGTKGRPLRPLV
jgi:hypothetical protein